MATYLQGVTDYIPQYQPFTPNLNFYDTILKTKQNQYDSNWKQLNNIYGKYFYADLTRDDNIKKKDELVKNINFNLQRVAGLDLSLQKNVDQAVQVFTPFYQDKNLMKDMAYTKNWNSEYGRGMGLKKATDEKRQKQFWDAGIQELQYLREEFKNAAPDEAMTFTSPTYTPYVNSTELAHDLAKKQGWNVKISKSDGRHIYTTKNGQQIMEPLRKLFENTIGNDSRVQSVYRTQSYVNRKNYANTNASMFDGDSKAAEMKYLENNFNVLKRQTQKYYTKLKADAKNKDTQINYLEEKAQRKNISPRQAMLLDDLKFNRDINRQTLSQIEKEYGDFDQSSSSTGSTTTGFTNPYGDINVLRRKVDGGIAQMLMRKDLSEAAETEAFRNYERTMKTDPYGLEKVRQANRKSIVDRKIRGDQATVRLQQNLKATAKVNEQLEKEKVLQKRFIKDEYKIDNFGRQVFKSTNPKAFSQIAGESTVYKRPMIDANGLIMYEANPKYGKFSSQVTTDKSQKVDLKTFAQKAKFKKREMVKVSNQLKRNFDGVQEIVSQMRTQIGDGPKQISQKEFDKFKVLNSKGKEVTINEMLKGIETGEFTEGDALRVYGNLYKFVTKSDTEIGDYYKNSPVFGTKNKVEMDALYRVIGEQREGMRKSNDIVEKYKKSLPEGMQNMSSDIIWNAMAGDEEGFNDAVKGMKVEVMGPEGITYRNVDEVMKTLDFRGDLVNKIGNLVGVDGQIISSGSVLGNMLGVNKQGKGMLDFDMLREDVLNFEDEEGVKTKDNLSKWFIENRGLTSEGNAAWGDKNTVTVGSQYGDGHGQFVQANDAIFKNPQATYGTGLSKESLEKMPDDIAKAIHRGLINYIGAGGDEKRHFLMSHHSVAQNSLDHEGVNYQLPPEYLKSLVGTKDNPGLLYGKTDLVTELSKKGLSVSVPSGTFGGLEIADTYTDPIERMIKNSPEGYTYNDP